MKVEVMNVPTETERYVVARICDCQLWYWGSWDNKKDADITAHEIDGVVVERADNEE